LEEGAIVIQRTSQFAQLPSRAAALMRD